MDNDFIDLDNLLEQAQIHYGHLKFPDRALFRDISELYLLGAILIDNNLDSDHIALNLDWPQQFSESELIERYQNMPSAASTNHPAMPELRRLLGRR